MAVSDRFELSQLNTTPSLNPFFGFKDGSKLFKKRFALQ
jgi:hypothetical protein